MATLGLLLSFSLLYAHIRIVSLRNRMNATAKAIHRESEGRVATKHCCSTRVIRFASHAKAKKAGRWTIKKYSGAFKKLAAA